MTNQYNWIDNPTEAQVAAYNPDILNECLMHLKYDNLPATATLGCFNSGNTDSNGYADLIEAQLSTEKIFSQSGTYTLNIAESGNYDVVLVGGGAGGAWGMDTNAVRSSSSGGSGAAFVGKIYIPAGTYTCTVGAGGSAAGNGSYGGAGGTTSISGIISVTGGSQGAYATWGIRNQSFGGSVSVNTDIISETVNSNGNNGTTAINANSAGGASVFNGFGKGGDAGVTFSNNGTSGFLSLKFQGASNINYKIGGTFKDLTGTLLSGEQFVIKGLNSDDASYLGNGNYIKFIGSDGSCELLKNNLYRQAVPPNANVGDVWFDTSTEPCKLFKYNGSQWLDYNKIPALSFSIHNGSVTDFKTFPYNQNGFSSNMHSPQGKPSGIYSDLVLPANGSTIIAPYNGYIQLSALSANSIELYNTSRNMFWNAVKNQNNGFLSISIPCQKGDVIQLYYEINTFRWLRCYADEGAY